MNKTLDANYVKDSEGIGVMEAPFLIYGKENCPHCTRAKEFLRSKGFSFTYLTLDKHYTKEHLIKECSPVVPKTLPRVFWRDSSGFKQYVGTADELISFVNSSSFPLTY